MSLSQSPPRHSRAFARYAWGVLGYTLLVIVFGAWVRITGSGAGCGEHWPTCHGEIVPRAPELATQIEYTHRITSGLLGPFCLAAASWAFFGASKRSANKRLSLLVTALVLIEALIGAGLVKGGLVADDDSLTRAIVVALHLGNTLLLTAACALLARSAGGHELRRPRAGDALALGLVALVCMIGAVTALGDTLFPVVAAQGPGALERVREGLAASEHFLVRLRLVHPVLASLLAVWLLWRSSEQARTAPPGSEARWLSGAVFAFVLLEVLCGVVNVMLSAPGWLQLLHLLLAQGVWLAIVVWSVTGPTVPRER